MFEKTSTECAPWHVIPGDSKRYARVQVLKTVNEAIEAGMKKWGVELPSLD
jgi:polyphosphate kinase 2 (PPK2 family)